MPTVRSADADIAYEVTGSGAPLLMIMGFAGDSRMWMFQTPAFAERFRCITFDNRGAGGSSSPHGPYTMGQMANDALHVLDAAAADRAHVLGISMGGAIAQHLALIAPDRVRSLTLAATWCSHNAYLTRIAELGLAISDNLGIEALIRASLLWLFTPRFIIEQHENLERIETLMVNLQAPPETFVNQLHAVLEHDVAADLAELQIPTRVMVGRRDTLVPPELSEELAKAVPGSDLVYLETGHAFNIEEAEAFNRTVLEFLERV